MASAFTEGLVLALVVFGGSSGAWLLGFRQTVWITAAGFVLAVLARVGIFMGLLSVDFPHSSKVVWASVMLATGMVGLLVSRADRRLLSAVSLGLLLGVVAVVLKHILRIGERFHEDSAQIVLWSLLVFGADNLHNDVKRGLALPLMLSSETDGSLLTVFIPFVFLVLVLVTFSFSRELTSATLPARNFAALVALLALVSLSTPMLRVLVFYINSHTMVALGIGLVMVAVIRLTRNLQLSSQDNVLLAIGGLFAVWSRYEGIVYFLVALAPLVLRCASLSARAKLKLGISAALPVTGWVAWSHFTAPDLPMFNSINPTLTGGLILIVGALALLLSEQLARLLFITSTLGFAGIAAYLILNSGQVTLLNQVRNLVLGLGGWGFVAPTMVLLLVVIGRRKKSRIYRLLLTYVMLVIFATVALKFFDGAGLGRQGFNDSINRAWSHWLFLWWVAPFVGLAEIMPKPRTDYTRRNPWPIRPSARKSPQ